METNFLGNINSNENIEQDDVNDIGNNLSIIPLQKDSFGKQVLFFNIFIVRISSDTYINILINIMKYSITVFKPIIKKKCFKNCSSM